MPVLLLCVVACNPTSSTPVSLPSVVLPSLDVPPVGLGCTPDYPVRQLLETSPDPAVTDAGYAAKKELLTAHLNEMVFCYNRAGNAIMLSNTGQMIFALEDLPFGVQLQSTPSVQALFLMHASGSGNTLVMPGDQVLVGGLPGELHLLKFTLDSDLSATWQVSEALYPSLVKQIGDALFNDSAKWTALATCTQATFESIQAYDKDNPGTPSVETWLSWLGAGHKISQCSDAIQAARDEPLWKTDPGVAPPTMEDGLGRLLEDSGWDRSALEDCFKILGVFEEWFKK
jgi:hypothetical protein